MIYEPGRPQTTIWRTRIACWITKSTYMLRICISHCFPTTTMVARTPLNMMYVHRLFCSLGLLTQPRLTTSVTLHSFPVDDASAHSVTAHSSPPRTAHTSVNLSTLAGATFVSPTSSPTNTFKSLHALRIAHFNIKKIAFCKVTFLDFIRFSHK